MDARKQAIIDALDKFVRQRSGMDSRNYSDGKSYRQKQRSITRDLHHYRALERAVILADGIGADALLAASKSAHSGWLTLTASILPSASNEDAGPLLEAGYRIDYCTGQYFPTEYRRAACAVLASALWYHARDNIEALERAQMAGRSYSVLDCLAPDGKSTGDRLRLYFIRQFGRTLAARWFN